MTTLQWWCSARGVPWSWSWQMYPGVWVAVALAGITIVRAVRAGVMKQKVAGVATLVLLLITLDWPLGPLGAGYLASAHALQFVMLAMIIPALWLLAVRSPVPEIRERLSNKRARADSIVQQLNHPLIAAVVFTLVMAFTHIPRVVDGLMSSQAGSFALDAIWLASGFIFWKPVINRGVSSAAFSIPMQMLYLFFGTQIHLLIAMWLLTAELPVYATYELSPRVIGLSALQDQQVAGGVMLLLGAPIVLCVISVLFFRWFSAGNSDAVSAT